MNDDVHQPRDFGLELKLFGVTPKVLRGHSLSFPSTRKIKSHVLTNSSSKMASALANIAATTRDESIAKPMASNKMASNFEQERLELYLIRTSESVADPVGTVLRLTSSFGGAPIPKFVPSWA